MTTVAILAEVGVGLLDAPRLSSVLINPANSTSLKTNAFSHLQGCLIYTATRQGFNSHLNELGPLTISHVVTKLGHEAPLVF